jgi:hypothetical protein
VVVRVAGSGKHDNLYDYEVYKKTYAVLVILKLVRLGSHNFP